MKKKIFFIMNSNDYSGAEAVNINIIENLKGKYDFFWVSTAGKIEKFLEIKKIKWIQINKLSVKEIRKIIKNYSPTVLHATDYRASVICSLATSKIPIISHLHNNPPWLKKFCINSIAYLLTSINFKKILIVSNSIKKEYIFSKILTKKFVCVNNPLIRKIIIEKAMENSIDKYYDICCVARITPQKNPIRFINIIHELSMIDKNIKIVWVGDGELKKQTTELVKKLNLQNNIDFVGFKENPFVYMKNSKLFMLTSEWEGFGLVAFEALTLGLPCIVSNVGGLTTIVNDSCGKLCNTNEDFVNFTSSILLSKRKIKQLSNNAIIRSKELENCEEYMNLLKKLYSNVIGEE